MGLYDPFASMFAPVSDPYQIPDPFASGGGGGSIFDPLFGLLGNWLNTQLPVPVGSPVSQLPTIPPITTLPNFPMPGLGGSTNQLPISTTGRCFLRRSRRMNPCNPRALHRAIRRVKRFEKFARQSVRITRKVKVRRRRSK